MSEELKTRNMAFAGFFGVLTAIGAYITIPVPPVPITGQTFFVLLAGLLLGPRWGAVAMVTYLVIGGAGFPVFHAGTGGVGILFGPTGGYLIGFPLAACTVGYIAQLAMGRPSRSRSRRLIFALAVSAGTAIIYLLGVPWLAFVSDLSLPHAITIGIIPFLIGDLLKAIAAVSVAETLWLTISFGPVPRR